jgi:hypothetical protein
MRQKNEPSVTSGRSGMSGGFFPVDRMDGEGKRRPRRSYILCRAAPSNRGRRQVTATAWRTPKGKPKPVAAAESLISLREDFFITENNL